jgi:hypothetical protein
VNGIAMSVSGIARAVAPGKGRLGFNNDDCTNITAALGGSAFAWSNNNGLDFPFNHYFVFEVMSIVLIFMFMLSFLISKNAIN